MNMYVMYGSIHTYMSVCEVLMYVIVTKLSTCNRPLNTIFQLIHADYSVVF